MIDECLLVLWLSVGFDGEGQSSIGLVRCGGFLGLGAILMMMKDVPIG